MYICDSIPRGTAVPLIGTVTETPHTRAIADRADHIHVGHGNGCSRLHRVAHCCGESCCTRPKRCHDQRSSGCQTCCWCCANDLIRTGANVEYMTLRKLLGDELVLEQHERGTLQVVSLGAGMDSRAFRLGLNDVTFFEVDKPGLFDVKEPLVSDVPQQCAARHTVIGTVGIMDLGASLRAAGFDSNRPTTWLMEGIFPYLSVPIMRQLASDIGRLSAPGSALWGDGFSKTSVDRGMEFHGVPFESGFDDYDELFRLAGFDDAKAVDMSGVHFDRQAKAVRIDPAYVLTPQRTHGREMCLMVRAYKN